jgi:thiol-disulfide isomerase/thioredoxin
LKGVESEEGVTYTDLDGNPVSLVAYKGKPLIINSWASWIPFSKDELKLLSLLQESDDAVTVIAINRMENVATIKAYLDFIGKPEGIVFLSDATDTFYKAIQGYAMPETVFYDRDGLIVRHVRGVLTESELNTVVESMRGRE